MRLPGATLSLQRQLLLWLLLPQLVLWVAGAWVSYTVALRYANIAVDRSLWQSARALSGQVKPLGNGLFIDFPRAAQQILEADPDDKVYYMVSSPPGKFILGNRKLPNPTNDLHYDVDKPFFYDGKMDKDSVRIAAVYLRYGEAHGGQEWMLVQVAKGVTVRERLAKEILYATVLPLSILMAATSLLVWWGIRRGLTPLRRLRRLVENRSARDLAPIQLASAPEEVRSLAEALNTLLAAVQHSVSSQRRFIDDAAHQLRTPLAGLKSQVELAQKEADPAQLQQRLAHAQASASRSIHMVNQLLTLARSEPEQAGGLSRTPLEVGKLIRDITADAVPRALRAQIDLGCETLRDPIIILGNSALLRELFLNLIDNAIRYIPKNSTVTLSVSAKPDTVTVNVTDDGPGIPDADKPRVFERFFRGAQDGNGCGLGLAIVQEIASRHGGTVHLFDVIPHGLRVSVTIPRNLEK